MNWLSHLWNSLHSRGYRISWESAPPFWSSDLTLGILFSQSTIWSIKEILESANFDTDVVLQSHSHREPTAAKAIGMPLNFPYGDFARWGDRVVLRIHVGVYSLGEKKIVVPHVEPCPRWSPLEHMVMVKRKDEVKGREAVEVLDWAIHHDSI